MFIVVVDELSEVLSRGGHQDGLEAALQFVSLIEEQRQAAVFPVGNSPCLDLLQTYIDI